jgi:hypothetical protein
MGRKLLWLPLLGAAALCFATCAPVHESPPEDVPQATKPAERPTNAVLLKMPQEVRGPRLRIELAIQNVRRRQLLTTNGFWTVFHGILGLGPGVTLADPENKSTVNALDYICKGGKLRGLEFLRREYAPDKWGLDVRSGTNAVAQGHQDQFVAEMAQWGMPANRKVMVDGIPYTFMDFVNYSQMRASTTRNQELSWATMLVAQYKGMDLTWTNMYGEKLSFEDLVKYEADASVEKAPCGGTHRLFGLTWVYHMHLQRGGKVEGVWKQIADKTAEYRDRAKKYRNADGSFSMNYFFGPGPVAGDTKGGISTSGHILEWLALALKEDELKQEWVQEAANRLALMILELADSDIDGGPLYHAVHGLQIYHARVYDKHSVAPPELLYPQPEDRPPLNFAQAELVKSPPAGKP